MGQHSHEKASGDIVVHNHFEPGTGHDHDWGQVGDDGVAKMIAEEAGAEKAVTVPGMLYKSAARARRSTPAERARLLAEADGWARKAMAATASRELCAGYMAKAADCRRRAG
jgi:hypothetical protein